MTKNSSKSPQGGKKQRSKFTNIQALAILASKGLKAMDLMPSNFNPTLNKNKIGLSNCSKTMGERYSYRELNSSRKRKRTSGETPKRRT